MKIEFLEEVGSTNDFIKRYLKGGEDVIVCAKRQTSGKGTKGRSFLSKEGGVYLSALTFYENLPASEAFKIMIHAAVAVCRTAEDFGIFPEIKWPNDILIDGRKVCGILIENTLMGNNIKASIVGIGLNVDNDLRGLENIACKFSEFALKKYCVEEVREALIQNYLLKSSFEEYLAYVKFLGRKVRVAENYREYAAIARRILPDGRLEIEHDGVLHTLSAAEISLKL